MRCPRRAHVSWGQWSSEDALRLGGPRHPRAPEGYLCEMSGGQDSADPTLGTLTPVLLAPVTVPSEEVTLPAIRERDNECSSCFEQHRRDKPGSAARDTLHVQGRAVVQRSHCRWLWVDLDFPTGLNHWRPRRDYLKKTGWCCGSKNPARWMMFSVPCTNQLPLDVRRFKEIHEYKDVSLNLMR